MLTITLLAAALTGFATWALSRMVLEMLRERDIMDRPNHRSSHAAPVPRGGGLAIMAIVLPSWLLLSLFTGTLAQTWPAVVGAFLLAAVSWLDDLKNLPPLPRLATQIVAVALSSLFMPASVELFDGALPLWLDRLFLAIAWLWFINLYNFMDGIDGITGVETIAIAGGLVLLVLISVWQGGGDWSRAALAAVLVGGAAGFLMLNWHPARLFMGDVGSVSLGYLLGYLLIWLAAGMGLWAAALLLPLYYWGDATVTLVSRLVRGEKIWQAHSEHAYQVAVRAGRSHAWVARRIMVVNVILLILALATLASGWWMWAALAVGMITVVAFLCYLRAQNGAESA